MPAVEQSLYSPIGVSAFTLIKPEAPADSPAADELFNAELRAIQDAFNRISSLTTVTVDTAMSSSERNVLVDLSGLVNSGDKLLIVLPPNPNIGDPPCYVMVQESGYHTSGSVAESCAVVTTSDDTPINGLVPDNSAFTNQPALFNPGDFIKFVYTDPEEGWKAHTSLSAVANPSVDFIAPAGGAFPWPAQDFHARTAVDMTFLPLAVYQPGQSFSASKDGAGDVIVGDSTYTFNSVAGPFVISTSFSRCQFTCLSDTVFEVVGTP